MGVTIDHAQAIAATLPRSYEALARDQVRFQVSRLAYAAFYHDDTIMGFGFPRDEREALVALEPDKFLMPRPSDMRYQWVCVRLDALDVDELQERLVDAWRMCVPKKWLPPTRVDCANARPSWRSPGGRRATDRCPRTTRLEVAQQVPPTARGMSRVSWLRSIAGALG